LAAGAGRPAGRFLAGRRAIAAAAVAAIAAAIFAIVRTRVPAVEAWRVARATVRPVAVGRGTILPPARVAVFPRIIGRVAKVFASPGAAVRPGDPLVELDGTAYSAQVDEAAAAVARAGRDAERAGDAVEAAARKLAQARGLAGKKIASPEYLEAAKLDVEAARRRQRTASEALDAARSRLALAREALVRTRVTSPAAGTVEAIRARPGETVAESSPVAEIVDVSTPVAKVEIRAAGGIVPGAAARVTVAGAAAAGVVREIAANKTADSPYVTVMIALPSAPAAVRPGMAAQARVDGAPRDGVLAVPVGALAIRPGSGKEDAVWVLADGRARRRAVVVGGVGERLAEITSGLREGETIAGGPASVLRRLDDGDRVRVDARRGE
jgi:RND family efflux transporter MFP subunit